MWLKFIILYKAGAFFLIPVNLAEDFMFSQE